MLERAGTCFPRAHRLLKPTEFKRVFAHPRKYGDKLLLLLVAPNQLRSARLGLAISIKSARNAVARNRVKRVIRESFRLHRTLVGKLDIIVTGRAGLATKTNQELRTALEKHWSTLANAKNPDPAD